MPLHEYQCDACSHRFEAIQKFSDPPIAICPKCGSSVRKLISSPAFQFKGTGWYVTDYAKKDAGAKEKEKGAASDGSEKSAPDKPDTAKAAKPDKADTTTKPAATSSTPSASPSSSKD
ncbi:MAG: transcriptional regulator [Acidobacteria bacterium]|nr:MAG: transcriptional regulator [Acidobacteriota bacterium]PYR49354.1 MAG: transcriptional regulator [Acidobacteriota bacterium]